LDPFLVRQVCKKKLYKKNNNLLINEILFKAYIGHPAFKKMGAKQAYSIIHGLVYLPLCFLGITALLISIIAIVSINPIVVSIFIIIKKK
jgi:AGZA family xanthine/uracil permease-like MFS transporter